MISEDAKDADRHDRRRRLRPADTHVVYPEDETHLITHLGRLSVPGTL